jgi:hypothetical protein
MGLPMFAGVPSETARELLPLRQVGSQELLKV